MGSGGVTCFLCEKEGRGDVGLVLGRAYPLTVSYCGVPFVAAPRLCQLCSLFYETCPDVQLRLRIHVMDHVLAHGRTF